MIQDLRWYQWLPIGLSLGALVGAVRLGTRGAFEDAAVRTIGHAELDAVLAQGLSDGRPAVTNLVVHPPRGDGVWWVMGSRITILQVHADPKNASSPLVEAEVRTPFKFPAASADISDELERTHEGSPQTAPMPSYAWTDVPATQMALWITGMGAVIGGIWPALLAMLVGAGFGRRLADLPYDLNAFPSGNETAPLASTKPIVAPIDTVQANGELIEKSGANDTLRDEPIVEPHLTQSVPPLDPPPPVEARPPKDYAGQFYPTQVHVPRRGDGFGGHSDRTA